MIGWVAARLALALAAAVLPARGWAQSAQLPQLISPEQLERRIAAGGITVVDVRPDVFTYLEGHLPDAVYLSVETLRAARDGVPTQLLPADTYDMLFTRVGIRMDRPVAIYSAGESRDIDATFLAWILQGFGHPAVYLLDGGYFTWTLEQRPVAQKYPAPVPGTFAAETFRPDSVTLDAMRAALAETKTTLVVDARNPEQFAGRAGAQLRRGHIPGAINHYWDDDLERGTFGVRWKSAGTLRASYLAQGITPDKTVLIYCNTATEASHVHFALRNLLSYPRVRVYVGAWNEWSEDESLPIVTGGAGEAAQQP